MAKSFAPVHPGNILMEEIPQPRGIHPCRSAKNIGAHPRRIHQIIHALNLQARHDQGKTRTTA